MPELPEVETELLYLRDTALGQQIDHVKVRVPGLVKAPSARTFARSLQGRRLAAAHRRGKYLIVTLDDGRSMILHFGMGGDLKYYKDPTDEPPYTRIEFLLSNGYRLAFTCPRNICRAMLVDDPSDIPALSVMGPEPLSGDFSASYFRKVIHESHHRRIKALLLDQSRIAGIGNIYADEILYDARVRPDRKSSSLSDDEIARIYRSTRKVLRCALKTADEKDFPAGFLVSRNSRGAGCPNGNHPMRKMTVGGRTSYFCPVCQK